MKKKKECSEHSSNDIKKKKSQMLGGLISQGPVMKVGVFNAKCNCLSPQREAQGSECTPK